MKRASTCFSLRRRADSSLRGPSPVLVLCLVFLIQSLSASFSSQRGTFLVRGQDYDDLINPVTDEWDYENPDQEPVTPDKDLDKLRPDESGKPDATGGKKDDNGGKKDDKDGQTEENKGEDNDKGTKNNRPDDENVEKKTKTNDVDTNLEVNTVGESEPIVPQPQGVTIVDGVAIVPAAVNGTVLVAVPEILPPVPVAQESSNLAVPPNAPVAESIAEVAEQSPGALTGAMAGAPPVVGLFAAALLFF